MQKAFKIRAILLAAVAFILSLDFSVRSAASQNFEEEKGSLTVTLTRQGEEKEAVSGVSLTLYRVGDLADKEGNLTLAPAFEKSGLALTDPREEGLEKDLAEYAEKQKISGATKKTDAEGRAVFGDLAAGLYLTAQKKAVKGYYPISAFLVSVPMTSKDGRELLYDVKANPKVEPKPEKPVPPPPVPPKKPSMIQTGQLKWPVPVLAVLGVLLFAAGWTVVYLEGRKDGKT